MYIVPINFVRDGQGLSAEQSGGSDSWTPEQYWEFVSGLAGEFERDQMRDVLAERGLRIVGCSIPSTEGK